MRHLHSHVKYGLVILQVAFLATLFFSFFGFIAMVLYILGEIDLVFLVEYFIFATTWESISIITFLRGLFWIVLKRNKKEVQK